MHFLPKANPLYEHISADKVSIPEILEKLGNGLFTGYVSYTADSFASYCIFAKGKLICAISSESGQDTTGFEAITRLFDRVFSSGGEINVFRMTTDLTMCAHALVLGKRLFNGEEVRQVDIRGMLARIKAQEMNGVVRFYTPDRYAMMFYRSGLPIGFYHDSSRSIEMSPDEARKVAALPGARLEVRSTKPVEELMHYDLLQLVNVGKLWEAAGWRHAARAAQNSTPPPPAEAPQEEAAAVPVERPSVISDHIGEKLAELYDDLQEVAMAYLSKEGRTMIERCMENNGGLTALLDSAKVTSFLAMVEAEAQVIDSHARIGEMVDLMGSEITGRLAV